MPVHRQVQATLTVAIAGPLAAPLAAQAVDFTISGHVNRALFVTDSDAGTKAGVANNGGSSTRVRANGSTELMGGNKVGIQLEYEEAGSSVKLRHANVQYSGAFGKFTLGQGSEAGDGSAYSDTTGVFGIGHGAGTSTDFTLGSFFGSLDAGDRVNMVRYDSPALGPVGAAFSVGNDDRVSGLLQLSQEFGGTFGAKLGWVGWPDPSRAGPNSGTGKRLNNPSTISASFGVDMASGLTVSGAWAKGDNHYVDFSDADEADSAFLKRFDLTPEYFVEPHERKQKAIVTDTDSHPTDPSYFQAEIGYKFNGGNTGVAVSWYRFGDFIVDGSEGTALGIGAKHTLPKAGADLYVAAQNYDVDLVKGKKGQDETVFVVGTLVKF